MVESPTYYHSLSPILKSLKEFDMENFPLQKEIVYTKASKKLPEYLREVTLDTSVVYRDTSNLDDDSEKMYSNESSENSDDDDGSETLPEYINEETFSKFALSRKSLIDDTDVIHSNKLSENSDDSNNDDNSNISSEYFGEENDIEDTYSSGSSKNIDKGIDEIKHSSEEALGGHMKVKQFLKVFKGSKNTSLEESQRIALMHVLKNKIGIIQGEGEVTAATQ